MKRLPSMDRLVKNELMARTAWLRKQMDPRRDIDLECGYPLTISVQDYKNFFVRGDLAARVVSVLPEESWNDGPQVFETEKPDQSPFEKRWEELRIQFSIFSVLQRADVLSGIGRFGALLIGIDDGVELSKPAPGLATLSQTEEEVVPEEHKLLFLRPFDESLVKVKSLENNIRHPRYGLPGSYEITFSGEDGTTTSGDVKTTGTSPTEVHWSRIIHLADNRMSSDVYGMPRMEKVFNRILDARKIAGGSGEMFWKGGFPGISLESVSGLEDTDIDVKATKEQLEAYMNGLQRYLATVGMKANSLNVNVADPSPHIEVQIRLIAMAMGIPWRVFVGSEAAQLASEQDTRAWNRRLARRREEYLSPYVLRPLIERLIIFGILPKPATMAIFWPDLNSPSDKDRADVAEKKTNAIAKYVQAGGDMLIPPFHFLTLILGMSDNEATAVLDEVDEDDLKEAREAALNPAPRATAPAPARRPANNGSH